MTRDVHVIGMHGLGDTLHERAIVRHLLNQDRTVWLETSWPQVFHDLRGPRLHLLRKPTPLRTQTKNAIGNVGEFHPGRPPAGAQAVQIHYTPAAVRRWGSVLGAMLDCSRMPDAGFDFRLPVPDDWAEGVRHLSGGRPILLYRPLVERTEWGGCAARNPDAEAYRELFESIADRFFVISVADLEPRVEWITSLPVSVQMQFHRGELAFPALAALIKRSALVFASPGFATILAQAVGTPSVCVFGGYETGSSFSAGARWAPHLSIQPVNPCGCFSHTHDCRKALDTPTEMQRLKVFVDEIATRQTASAAD